MKNYKEKDMTEVSIDGKTVYVKDEYLKECIKEDAGKIEVNRIGYRFFVDPQDALARSMKNLGSGTKVGDKIAKKLARLYKKADRK